MRAGALTLAQIVDQALCNNPQTAAAWANACAQAAQVGIARSEYLPAIGAIGAATVTDSDGSTRAAGAQSSGAGRSTQRSAGVTLSYLLYDFGARDAVLEGSLQTLAALSGRQDATYRGCS